LQIDAALAKDIRLVVARALQEDVGSGDLTAGLVPPHATSTGTITAREPMTMAGRPWVDEVYARLDAAVELQWLFADGDRIDADTVICSLRGPSRSLLTGERCALNLLQTLSATATVTARYVAAVAGTGCRILDTRKTLPGLRLAQKYAVRCGGGWNHRVGLFDAILIKENHISAAGSIANAVRAARDMHPGVPIEVEVESLDELRQGLAASVERLMLDDFTLDQMAEAVRINLAEGSPPAELEASGGMTLDGIREVAATGVDFISVGALTKNVQAIDLSMRLDRD
jgi:nicotinate-nucleotide pyrophosphorylase (carboxylating)